MTKHRFRESLKSFFGHHVDPEKDEQLKGSKIEIDDKVTKILKLIKGEEVEENDGIPIANSKKEPLVQLIEDFHKQYQNLYSQYDHLTGELRKQVRGKREKDASSSSSSDSDSDYSSKDGGSKNGQLESEFQKIAEGIKQELEAANLEIADLKRKLTATNEEKDALNSDYLASLSKVQELEEIIKNLKHESDRSESEKSKLVVENEELRHKLDNAAKIEAEVNQRLEELNRENNKLILEKEAAVKRIEDGEKFTVDLRGEVDRLKEENLTRKQELESVRGEVSCMQLQLESAEQQVSELSHSLNATVEENKSLNLKLSEASNELKQAQGTIQQLMAQMSRSNEELGEKERELLTLKELHEVHGNQSSAQIKELEAQVTSLELELESLRETNRDMEVQIENKASEAKQLGEQNIGLQSQISELEMMSEKREEELLSLTKKFEDNEKESLSRAENLTVQINNLLVDMESLRTQNAQLEEHIVFKGDESSSQVKSLMDRINTLQQELEMAADLKQMVEDLHRDLEAKRNEKNDFINQITDHQRMLKEQEDAFNKLSEEYKQLGTSFQDSKAIIEVKERKMQEMAGEHNKNVQSKDQIIADLEQNIEELKRDLEMKGDEFSTLVENMRTIEVKLRLSNQKLRVTEQLLNEKEESFRKAEAKFLEEQRMLEERITKLSGIIAANNEAYSRMITDISENVNSTLTGFEAVIQNFEEGYRNYMHCVEETSKELRIAKHWVEETKSEKKQLMNKTISLTEQMKHQIDQESMLKERVEKLQIKVNKEEGEKENLLQAMKHLEKKVELLETALKEKDQGILDLGEEKREAIRQLCLWIDYHRSRCDDLMEILSKTVRVQRAT
ncbi:hypothetical protein REPUB_Repub07fG0184300 [Reevesia pubescens]